MIESYKIGFEFSKFCVLQTKKKKKKKKSKRTGMIALLHSRGAFRDSGACAGVGAGVGYGNF